MLFIRYVALAILIVLMPIAWVAWIFPNIKIPGGNPSQLWWSQFIKWLLFAPISMFFFFLAIKTATSQDILQYTNSGSDGLGSDLGMFATAVCNMMLVVGFLLGGMIVAQKMSITGSKWVMKIAKDRGEALKKWAWTKTKIAATYPARKAGPEFGGEGERLRKPTMTERLQRSGRSWPTAMKPLAAPARAIGNLMATARIAGEKTYKEAKEKVDKLSIDEMEKRYGSADSPAQLAILSNILGEIKKLNDKEAKLRKDDPTAQLDPGDRSRLGKLNAILENLKLPDPRARHEKLKNLYAQNELRVGKKSDDLAEAFREEGRDEGKKSTPPPSTPPPAPAPTTPTP